MPTYTFSDQKISTLIFHFGTAFIKFQSSVQVDGMMSYGIIRYQQNFQKMVKNILRIIKKNFSNILKGFKIKVTILQSSHC